MSAMIVLLSFGLLLQSSTPAPGSSTNEPITTTPTTNPDTTPTFELGSTDANIDNPDPETTNAPTTPSQTVTSTTTTTIPDASTVQIVCADRFLNSGMQFTDDSNNPATAPFETNLHPSVTLADDTHTGTFPTWDFDFCQQIAANLSFNIRTHCPFAENAFYSADPTHQIIECTEQVYLQSNGANHAIQPLTLHNCNPVRLHALNELSDLNFTCIPTYGILQSVDCTSAASRLNEMLHSSYYTDVICTTTTATSSTTTSSVTTTTSSTTTITTTTTKSKTALIAGSVGGAVVVLGGAGVWWAYRSKLPFQNGEMSETFL